MIPLIVIAGPTAIGKSDVAFELAKRLNTEIISADSMQVYRYMDIGTAKPNLEERARVPHYLIDIANPDETISLAVFQKKAERQHQSHGTPLCRFSGNAQTWRCARY